MSHLHTLGKLILLSRTRIRRRALEDQRAERGIESELGGAPEEKEIHVYTVSVHGMAVLFSYKACFFRKNGFLNVLRFLTRLPCACDMCH